MHCNERKSRKASRQCTDRSPLLPVACIGYPNKPDNYIDVKNFSTQRINYDSVI